MEVTVFYVNVFGAVGVVLLFVIAPAPFAGTDFVTPGVQIKGLTLEILGPEGGWVGGSVARRVVGGCNRTAGGC